MCLNFFRVAELRKVLRHSESKNLWDTCSWGIWSNIANFFLIHMQTVKTAALKNIFLSFWYISFIATTFKHVPKISFSFKVLFIKSFSVTLCLGLSVPGDVPRCSASMLALLASFINSVAATVLRLEIGALKCEFWGSHYWH